MGLAVFVALRECVVGLDRMAVVVMEQWEVQKTMHVLKRKVNINLSFSLQKNNLWWVIHFIYAQRVPGFLSTWVAMCFMWEFNLNSKEYPVFLSTRVAMCFMWEFYLNSKEYPVFLSTREAMCFMWEIY